MPAQANLWRVFGMTASRATKRDRGAIRFSSALLRCGLCCRPPPLCGRLRRTQPRQGSSAKRRPRERVVPREGAASGRTNTQSCARQCSGMRRRRRHGLPHNAVILPPAPYPKLRSSGRASGAKSGSELQPPWCRNLGGACAPNVQTYDQKRDRFGARKTRPV